MAPGAGQHAGGQLAEAERLLQDAVVHALPRRRGHAPLREGGAVGLGYGAGEVGGASVCKRVVLHGGGGGGGGRAGGRGGRGGGQRRGRRGVPEAAAAAAAAAGVAQGGQLRALAEQQQLVAGDLPVGGVRTRRGGLVGRLAADGGVQGVCVVASFLRRLPERTAPVINNSKPHPEPA